MYHVPCKIKQSLVFSVYVIFLGCLANILAFNLFWFLAKAVRLSLFGFLVSIQHESKSKKFDDLVLTGGVGALLYVEILLEPEVFLPLELLFFSAFPS